MGLLWFRKSARPKVLVIEDDMSVQRLLMETLSSYNFEPVVASTSEEGLELAKKAVPAMILLDMNLPDGHGLDLLARLKLDPGTRAIPVLMVTAQQTGSDVENAFTRGAAGYVIKPFDGAKVVDKIRSILALSA